MNVSINKVGLATQKLQKSQNNAVQSSPVASQNNMSGFSKAAAQSLRLNSLNYAKTVQFTGALVGAFSELNNTMVTCKTKDSDGEAVGSMANVNKLLHDYQGEFQQTNDAIKTTILVDKKEIDGKKVPIYARTQIKLLDGAKADNQNLRFEMAVRQPSHEFVGSKKDPLAQLVQIDMTPVNYKGEGVREQAYILNTKGNIMAVIEDGDDVVLTNAGKITKRENASSGKLHINAVEYQKKPGDETTLYENKFKPFTPAPQEVALRTHLPSIGEGTEIVIGMENGRFVNEIKASIKEFIDKVEHSEIILPQFVADPNAKDTQLIMLAGGFGSRAEYTNASSDAIFHNVENGAQSTKGVFRTATGLTPMETTLITLHKAGLLDCSKGKLKIGDNIKFYLNKGQNRGNGEFSADLYSTMQRPGRKQAMIFPNDSMSRMTNAVIEANKLMSTGKAAIAMIAKKVKAQDCIKTFGIMQLGPNNEILNFLEKPSVIPPQYIDKDGMCLTNTFQFAVSDEAFEVLDMFEPYFIPNGKKESRDWSKQYVPILQALTQETDINEIKTRLAQSLNNTPENISDGIIEKAKSILGDQKIFAVPTSEPWADCGTLNQLFHTTMQIASGAFPLEDFERAHVLDCVNTKTGLVASSKDQKDRISKKYKIEGQVMAVPQAKAVDASLLEDIPVAIHED